MVLNYILPGMNNIKIFRQSNFENHITSNVDAGNQ